MNKTARAGYGPTEKYQTAGSAKTKSNLIEAPVVSLPKGGGAIRSIDEKFAVNPANGTAGFSIPFPFSPSRNDFLPGLTLSYNSGSGNGIFGLGWNAEVPSISRRTDKKLPRYDDSAESDTFIYSGAEDLVPSFIRTDSGEWVREEKTAGGDKIASYKPRVEGNFAKIEKISEASGNTYWKVTSRNNVVSIFGRSKSARIHDPANDSKIFRWFLEFSCDDKGNCFQFEFLPENKLNVPNLLHENNRLNGNSSFTNVYLKRVRYANRAHFDWTSLNSSNWEGLLSGNEYLLELVVDYGDHDPVDPQPQPDRDWECRMDAFSTYHAGFEIRTYRICQRILMFHHFAELGDRPCLVRSLNFSYNSGTAFTFLKSVTEKGYIRKSDGTYSVKSVPPMEFNYEPLGWNTEVSSLSAESMENLPAGIDDRTYRWIDLYGEGVSGILTEQANSWFYKSNSGDGKLGPVKQISPKPSLNGLSMAEVHFQDVEANGQKFLVSHDLNGFYELTPQDEWLPFRAFNEMPSADMRDPNVKTLDLDGDGRTDILVSEEEVFVWYESRGKEGFGNYQTTRKVRDEETGPGIIFADSTESITIADMSGDGLPDIVRIRNHDIVYWPNLGYGRFGAKVSMSNAPVFDQDDRFNPGYIKLADLDGSGNTDIVYLGKDSFRIYFNQSGNSWSDVNMIQGVNPLPFPKIDDHSGIQIIDLLGNGTGCIVWSSPLPEHASNPLRYINLMNGFKPHIMTSYKNNMGKEVAIHYKPSTFFYLSDKAAGKPWITRLPFPVHCVSEMAVTDGITKARYTKQYTYHHGNYDYTEREFRGFGRVDQTDTESFENFSKHANPDGSIQIVDENFHQPPTLIKTWFHTGAFLDNETVLNQFAHEYFNNTAIPEKILAEPALSPDWTPEEWREAMRACKGLPLHVEVYSLDGSTQEDLPYTTAHHTCLIRLLQPRLKNRYAVFMVQEGESLTYTCERNPDDPRISHSINLETDEFGNVLKSAAISYGRKITDNSLTADEQAEQAKTRIVCSESSFTQKIDNAADYRLPVLYESRTYELTGSAPIDGNYFTGNQILNDFEIAAIIPYQALPSAGSVEKRLIECIRNLFLKNDQSGPLLLGETESLLLPYQVYQLALTPDLCGFIFGDKFSDALLINEGKYFRFEDGNYWIASGTRAFDAAHFYQITEINDPFGNRIHISYDSAYHFFIQQITEPLQNTSRVAGFNFRTLSPYLMLDINDNRSGVRLDELGMVQSTFVMAREQEAKGDILDVNSVEASPADQPTSIFEYDLFSFVNQGKPCVISNRVRETHYFESIDTGNPVIWQASYAYFDGFSNVVMSKIQAEPGLALQENEDGSVTEVDTTPDVRWVGNGRTIRNNKGQPVMQYEPYFSVTSGFEDARALVERGVTPVIHYDSAGRAIRTDKPDGTFIRVEFDPWKQVSHDQNDTVLESRWYRDRIITPVPIVATPEEINAANKAAVHANTPLVDHLDPLGRNFLSIADNGTEGKYRTVTGIDIEGNVLKITDARGNSVMHYKYDMLGNPLYQASLDAGEHWVLADISGKPIRTWDSRNHEFHFAYDELHRPTLKKVRGGDGSVPLDHVFNKIIYGENLPDNKTRNLRGKPVITYDTSGKAETSAFDYKGNALGFSRRLVSDYKEMVDWGIPDPDSALEAETLSTTRAYDALDRIIQQVSPDGSLYEPHYNEAGLLEKVRVTQNGVPREYVKNIDYNEKGQRKRIIYGNDVSTNYFYDAKTFRLIHLETRRINNDPLQDLFYTSDPVGNITRIEDRNVPVVFFNNQKIAGVADYTYDAIYRLKEATGREHAGQLSFGDSDDWNDLPFLKKYNSGSAFDWRNYTQQYRYDPAGNMLQMKHLAGTGSWTRDYNPDVSTNRLLSTQVGADHYGYSYHPRHGFVTSLPHLPLMQWNFKDELQAVSRQNVNSGTPEITWYVYDGLGQRIRKITERQASAGANPSRKSERIYADGIEIFREYDNANMLTLERKTYHVSDDTGRIAMIETRTAGTDDAPARLERYQFGNHLGSACIETDETARVISYEEFHPYGTTSYQAADKDIKAVYKRYRFTGMERDEESGLEYHSARYYLPWLGRWSNPDPLGIKDGLNTYRSFHNNPVMYKDPDGLENKPINFVEYAPSFQSGLNRIAQLGVEQGIEFGLAMDPKTKKFMVVQGSTHQVTFFGNLIPLAHTHTGEDLSVDPSSADLDTLAKKKVQEHWIYSEDDGWARLRYDAKTKTFDVLLNRGKQAVRFTIFENPKFNPKIKTQEMQMKRWINSIEDLKGEYFVEPAKISEGPPTTPGISLPKWGARALFGSVTAAGIFVMWHRYSKAIQSDVKGHTGGINTLNLLQSDVKWYAIGEGIAALGPGARTAVANASYFFIATEVGKMIFGEDDTLRADPNTGREIRWIEIDDPEAAKLDMHTYAPHVLDVKTHKWAPAMERCFGLYGTNCAYVTEREYQEITDPWR